MQFFRTAVAGWRHGPGQDASQESAHVAKITGELKLNKSAAKITLNSVLAASDDAGRSIRE